MSLPNTRISRRTPAPQISATAWFGLLVVFVVTWGCGDTSSQSTESRRATSGGGAVCEKGAPAPSATVTPRVESLGPTSNAIRRGGEHLWIVESGSNTVSRYNPKTGSFEQGFIDVGNGRNPYDVAVAPNDERAYVTNYLTDSITVADTRTGRVVREIEVDPLDKPEGVAVVGRYLYVSNVHFTGGEEPFDPGSIVVFDRTNDMEVVGTARTKRKNPQFVRPVETPRGTRVAVVSSGVIDFLDGERAAAVSPGGLELWKPNGRTDDAARRTFPLAEVDDDRHGAPGRPLPTPDGRHLYFTSATDGSLFKFDLRQRTWVHGTRDRLTLYDAEGNALHHGAIDSRGILHVTAFNDDALYLWDTTCDERLEGPIGIGTTDGLLEGPHGVAIREQSSRQQVFFIMSRANALGRVTLDFP